MEMCYDLTMLSQQANIYMTSMPIILAYEYVLSSNLICTTFTTNLLLIGFALGERTGP